jgi:uncharacterized lipoprotein YddW (UPF0748 family)
VILLRKEVTIFSIDRKIYYVFTKATHNQSSSIGRKVFKSRYANLILLVIITGCGIKQVVRFNELPKEPIQQIPNELRGAWVTGSSWADANPDTMKRRIPRIMNTLAEANFNTVFFQVREQSETFYPSELETWSRLVDYKNPGFDPVKIAVDQAHKNGLKFYAMSHQRILIICISSMDHRWIWKIAGYVLAKMAKQ